MKTAKIFLVIFLWARVSTVLAQKPLIDTNILGKFPAINSPMISNR